MKTTVQVDDKTLDRLKKLKTTNRDTYIEIINRLMDLAEEVNKRVK